MGAGEENKKQVRMCPSHFTRVLQPQTEERQPGEEWKLSGLNELTGARRRNTDGFICPHTGLCRPEDTKCLTSPAPHPKAVVNQEHT